MHKMLSAFKSRNWHRCGRERDLSRASSEIESCEAGRQRTGGEYVKQEVDSEPSEETLVPWVHDLD